MKASYYLPHFLGQKANKMKCRNRESWIGGNFHVIKIDKGKIKSGEIYSNRRRGKEQSSIEKP